jgi:hypothetical protein
MLIKDSILYPPWDQDPRPTCMGYCAAGARNICVGFACHAQNSCIYDVQMLCAPTAQKGCYFWTSLLIIYACCHHIPCVFGTEYTVPENDEMSRPWAAKIFRQNRHGNRNCEVLDQFIHADACKNCQSRFNQTSPVKSRSYLVYLSTKHDEDPMPASVCAFSLWRPLCIHVVSYAQTTFSIILSNIHDGNHLFKFRGDPYHLTPTYLFNQLIRWLGPHREFNDNIRICNRQKTADGVVDDRKKVNPFAHREVSHQYEYENDNEHVMNSFSNNQMA